MEVVGEGDWGRIDQGPAAGPHDGLSKGHSQHTEWLYYKGFARPRHLQGKCGNNAKSNRFVLFDPVYDFGGL